MDAQSLSTCECKVLAYAPSSYASEAGYKRPGPRALVNAAGQKAGSTVPDPNTFPAPLVLPDDDLALDPEWPAQDVAEWEADEDRNPVTKKRNVIYVAAPPAIGDEVGFMSAWTKPNCESPGNAITPSVHDVRDYIDAFYHGMPVKALPNKFRFTAWDEPPKSKGKTGSRLKSAFTAPKFIGLNNGKECVRITTRPTRDSRFERQLKVGDLIDAVISMLPKDAYALMLLVHHDIYESDDDDSVGGRAYGGSRAAVASMARYNPCFDEEDGSEREHAWPASHCAYLRNYVAEHQEGHSRKKTKVQKTAGRKQDEGPIREAVNAYKRCLSQGGTSYSKESVTGIWLGRVCRTVSHELGHCFGIDHCVYYACSMQGTASSAEDVRQPPYLCPVDLEKVLRATGVSITDRYKALQRFCSSHSHVSLFAAFAAWLAARLAELEEDQTTEREVITISP